MSTSRKSAMRSAPLAPEIVDEVGGVDEQHERLVAIRPPRGQVFHGRPPVDPFVEQLVHVAIPHRWPWCDAVQGCDGVEGLYHFRPHLAPVVCQ